jgi:hypothetical protein
METLELARQALTALAPFVAQGALAKIGEDTTDHVTQLVGRAWGFLQNGAQGNPKAENALEVYQEEPDDERNMERLAKLLAEHLQQHHQAVNELRDIVTQLQQQAPSSGVHNNQTINNQASNKGAQGIFQGPVNFGKDKK